MTEALASWVSFWLALWPPGGLGAELVYVACYVDARSLRRFEGGFYYINLYSFKAEEEMCLTS